MGAEFADRPSGSWTLRTSLQRVFTAGVLAIGTIGSKLRSETQTISQSEKRNHGREGTSSCTKL